MSEDELENMEGFDGSDSDDGNGELDLDSNSEASGDDDDEGDGEGSEMSQLAKEIADHKKQLDSLKERDPEFYKYLEENNQELLNFSVAADAEGGEDEDVEMAEGEEREEGVEGEGEGEENEAGEEGVGEEEDMGEEGDDSTEVTKERVTRWKNATLKNHSIRSLRKMLLAFRAAAAVGDSSDEGHYSYKVEDGAVFNRLLLNTLRAAPVVFDHHLFGDKPRKGLPSGNSKWKRLQPLVKSFLMNLLRFLKQMTDVSVLTFVLRESEASAPYFACFPKLGKDYLKQLLKFWTSADEQVRIVSFLCIRKMAVSAPSPYLDMCLKVGRCYFLHFPV